MLASYVLAEEHTQILAKLAYQRCNYCKCLISRKCSHIKRYDSSLAKSIKCCFKRRSLFLTVMKLVSKSRLTHDFSLWKERFSLWKTQPSGPGPGITVSGGLHPMQRAHRNLNTQWGKQGNWFGCFMPQILFSPAYVQTTLKINWSEAIKDIFTVFKRSTVLWTCREGKVF